jgi:hypothetical protein
MIWVYLSGALLLLSGVFAVFATKAQEMIQPISRRIFDAFNPERSSIPVNRLEEVEWFAERSKVVIGFVARDG